MPIYLLSPSTILVVEVIIKLKNMIDDKQIEEAKDNIFNKHFLKNNEGMICVDHISEPVYLDYQIKQAIELGARWAINEFLKNLWHQNTEEPDKSKSDIITLGFDNDAYLQFKESILWNEESWRHSISRCQITKWAYLSDILPKKEDEQ